MRRVKLLNGDEQEARKHIAKRKRKKYLIKKLEKTSTFYNQIWVMAVVDR